MSVYYDVDWAMISFEPKPKPVPVVAASDPEDDVCPKCGKPLKARGKHLHIRACKGKP